MQKIPVLRELFSLLCCLLVCTLSCAEEADPEAGMLRVRESETREVKDLSGLWNFRADMSKDRMAGFRENWHLKPLSKTGDTIPMPVPSSYNDITQDRAIRDFIGWAWYDREFYVPKSWGNTQRNRVVLRFESAHYYSIVWVNGKKVMEHNGGHLPFEAEISTFLNYDRVNLVTAAINNTLTPITLPPGTIEYPAGGDGYPPGYFVQKYTFDFFNYAGIHRPVKLYTTPVAFLQDITLNTIYSPSNQAAQVSFASGISAQEGITKNDIIMEYQLLDKENFVVGQASGASLFQGAISVKNPILWWPVGMSNTTAYLYTLQVATTVPSKNLTDIYRIPVGIRTVKVLGTRFLINGKDFYFKGFGKHEDADIRGKGLDYALIAKDFNLMKWLGGNSFRTSHYPYAEEIMDMADQQGIVVIDETPGVGIGFNNYNEQLLKHHLEVMNELIRRDKNRPAVVMWSVANEPKSDIPAAANYFEEIFKTTRELDPTRPVTYVTHFKAWNDKVSQFSDVILCNRYYSWYHDYGHTELISQQLEKELRDWYNKFKKPVVQAEYGADTVAGLHVDPPVMFTEEYQVETIQQYFPVFDKLRSEFFVGEMIWNFADFMTTQGITRVVGNKKGILTRQRQPKAAAFILRQRYLNITLEQTPSNTGDDLLDALIKFESRAPAVAPPYQQDFYAQG